MVDGDIVGDVSMKDSLYWGSGWLWDDAPAAYQPYLSPLMLNKGVLQLSILPDERGLSALVIGHPSSTYYTIENHTRSRSSAAGPLRVARNWMENGNHITLQGNVQTAEGRSFSLFDSGRMFMHVFVERLMEAGIHCTAVADSTRAGIEAAYRFADLPQEGRRTKLAVHETSLQAVLNVMLRRSQNRTLKPCSAGRACWPRAARSGCRPRTDWTPCGLSSDVSGWIPKHYSLADRVRPVALRLPFARAAGGHASLCLFAQ